nr:VCBS repeat-containing protein [Pyrinomonadaceae bacterium]
MKIWVANRTQTGAVVATARVLALACLLLLGSTGVANATTFVVTKFVDTNDGICNEDCSLREAIVAAGTVATDDVIVFDEMIFSIPRIITLNFGEFTVLRSGTLTITGPSTERLTIDGRNASRILSNEAVLVISNITLTGGNGMGNNAGVGGAIFNSWASPLTLNNVIITGNAANQAGGIYNNENSSLILNDSVVSYNTSPNQVGGIYNRDSSLALNRSVVTANHGPGIVNSGAANITDSTVSNNIGASGIQNFGTINLSNSTVSGNTTTSSGGGGIFSSSNQTVLNITNSTITGNSSTGWGGGIYIIPGATVNLINSTVTDNIADSDNSGSGNGGGIANLFGGTVNARSSIIAANQDKTGVAPDFSGSLTSQGYNLLVSTAGLSIQGTTTGNIIGQEPLLLPLADYGGPTKTHALKPGSPAIDKADPLNFPAADQRGLARPHDGDLNGSVLPDIGAFEKHLLPFLVTKTADTDDTICDGDCSLREAIGAANAVATSALEAVITFDHDIFNVPRVITLIEGELTVNNDGFFSIQGPAANLLTITGNNSSRVFYLTGGATVTLSGITVTGGNGSGISSGSGGGIYNDNCVLSITNAVIAANSANFGGGVFSSSPFFDVVNSTIRNNNALMAGGGVLNVNAGVMNIENSAFSENSGSDGGGLRNSGGSVTIEGSSFSANSSENGGGIQNVDSGVLSIKNSSFTENNATLSGGGIGSTGTLTILNTTVDGNTTGPNGTGGGITTAGDTTIDRSTVAHNTAGSDGGGIRSEATVIVEKSSVSANSSGNRGGGIYGVGQVQIRSSLLDSNTALQSGGGIYCGSSLHVSVSTLTGNAAEGPMGGGGVHISTQSPAFSSVVHSTIAGNHATSGNGGGVLNQLGNLSVRSSIIGDNTSSLNSSPDFSGTFFSQGWNLVENPNGIVFAGTPEGDIIGQDPRLAPLANSGGPTQTQALLNGSPAIDAATTANAGLFDQRGFGRSWDGNGDGISRPDIGSYELRTVVVNNAADNGVGSLRQAIATAAIDRDAIVFSPSFFGTPQTITLTSGELVFASGSNFALFGRGANNLTISGNNQSRVMYVAGDARIVIDGITITGGNGVGSLNSGHDGGVSNWGTLTVSRSLIRNNSANGNGGGIGTNTNSHLTLRDSTIRSNSATTIAGGGLFIQSGTAEVTGTTINSNSAAGVGGGIASIFGTAHMSNSTISGNIAGNGGGGISNFTASSTLALNNTTISGNSTSNSSGGGVNNATGGTVTAANTLIANNSGTAADFAGSLTSEGYNLIEDSTGAMINGSTIGNIIGQDPRLSPLADHGGLSETHALLAGSPAIDQGLGALAIDQRGHPRPFDFSSIPNAPGGNGADIGAFENQEADESGRAPFDYDGDGKTDFSVFRPSSGAWYLQRSTAGFQGLQFGASGDKLAPADYDGDGKTDIAIYRPSTGIWYILNSSNGTVSYPVFGVAEDLPAPGDYDGDGKADITVFRPSQGTWYRTNSSNGTTFGMQFGQNGDVPTVGDFDGDGKNDLGIFRPSVGDWYNIRSSNGSVFGERFGQIGDRIAPADYDGDGKTDIAIYRPSTGLWVVRKSATATYSYEVF